MAATFASFQLLGSAVSSKDFLKIVVRSLACIYFASYKNKWCIWSVPCDFPFFNSFSTFSTFSSVILIVFSGSSKLRSRNSGRFPLSSTSKTLKNTHSEYLQFPDQLLLRFRRAFLDYLHLILY